MKRLLTALVTVLLLSMALAGTASASDFDAAAEDLSVIGMFRGTEAGFELDRAPTRSEAAIMLVRLYGAEEKAAADYAAGVISHPFTDVSAYTSPYVAWLYTNGLTNGITDTTFGSSNACSAQQYTVFLLRALGYRDGTDFEYADALNFAAGKGVTDLSAFSGTFLRDDLAALTYQALGVDLKDGSAYLLESLVDSGAIDAEAAKPITEKVETYRALVSAVGDTMGTALDADFEMQMDMDVNVSGVSGDDALSEADTMGETFSGRIQIILGEDPQLAMTMEGTTMGTALTAGEWLTDGWMYVESTVGEESSKVKYRLDDFMEAYQALLDQNMSQMNVTLLPFIDTITAKSSGSSTVYTLQLNNALSGVYDDLSGMLGGFQTEGMGMDMSMDIQNCTYTYTVNSKGQLTHSSAVMDLIMAMTIDGGESGSVTMETSMNADIQMEVNATGSDVKITFPDFSDFEEIVMPAA